MNIIYLEWFVFKMYVVIFRWMYTYYEIKKKFFYNNYNIFFKYEEDYFFF